MRGEIKKRLALLSTLLVAALAAGIVTASGASNSLKFAGKEVKVVVMNE